MTNNLFELLHLVEGMHATACEQNGGVVYSIHSISPVCGFSFART